MNAAGQTFEAEVSPFNNRQYGKFSGYFKQLLTKMGLNTGEFVWEVEGKAGAECHAWLNTDLAAGAFAKTKLTLDDKVYTTPEGDGNYATGAGAASIPSSISVASYNNATSFTSLVVTLIHTQALWAKLPILATSQVVVLRSAPTRRHCLRPRLQPLVVW